MSGMLVYVSAARPPADTVPQARAVDGDVEKMWTTAEALLGNARSLFAPQRAPLNRHGLRAAGLALEVCKLTFRYRAERTEAGFLRYDQWASGDPVSVLSPATAGRLKVAASNSSHRVFGTPGKEVWFPPVKGQQQAAAEPAIATVVWDLIEAETALVRTDYHCIPIGGRTKARCVVLPTTDMPWAVRQRAPGTEVFLRDDQPGWDPEHNDIHGAVVRKNRLRLTDWRDIIPGALVDRALSPGVQCVCFGAMDAHDFDRGLDTKPRLIGNVWTNRENTKPLTDRSGHYTKRGLL